MDIEIFEYDGSDYDRTMSFESWRVAFLNYSERFDIIDKLERHMLTDEVFILLKGCATLLVGENMKEYPMENNKLYNVKKGVWHAIKVSQDAKIVVVENNNTSRDNTEYMLV